MTRDQAIRKFMEAKGMPNHPDWSGDFKDVGRFIDELAALGLIRLDELKGHPQFDFLTDVAVLLSASAAAIITDLLAQRNLKVVEK